MSSDEINWKDLKRDYPEWRGRLWSETQRLLTGSDKIGLSQYNQIGYFHRVRDPKYFEQMKQEWEQLGKLPERWIGKGNFPGIWTALFDPCNTFSVVDSLPVLVIRFYFKEGYFLFDRERSSHKRLLGKWLEKGEIVDNPWEGLRNHHGESLAEKMKLYGYPSSKNFFKEHNFGAIIGYSDYLSVVIVLEESIQKLEFLVIE